jgi:hypothetical protein
MRFPSLERRQEIRGKSAKSETEEKRRVDPWRKSARFGHHALLNAVRSDLKVGGHLNTGIS